MITKKYGSDLETQMSDDQITSRTVFHDESERTLGQIRHAAYIKNSIGLSYPPMRVLGRYAIVYLLEGGGQYADANGYRCDVTAGDLIVVFPELAHGYGPKSGQQWSELYILFDGQIFDTWRETGLLDTRRPIHRLEPIAEWRERLETSVQLPSLPTGAAQTVQLSRFLNLLTEMLAIQPIVTQDTQEPAWLLQARRLLDMELGRALSPTEVSDQVGLSYEAFRKQFLAHVGLSPARYRLGRKIDAACSLLIYTQMTLRQIADSLGFSDEFHFSNRFKQQMGVSPTRYRKEQNSVSAKGDRTASSQTRK